MSDEQPDGPYGTTVVNAPADATVQVTVTPKPEPVAAHFQELTVHVRVFYPEHFERADDPHYALFNRARRALEKAGKLVCWRCGKDEAAAGHPIELHHTHIEQALINAVDVEQVIEKCPEWHVETEEELIGWLESPSNLTALCIDCHRGKEGIHCLPYPVWEVGRYERAGLPPTAQVTQ